jgi:hypothetical protein
MSLIYVPSTPSQTTVKTAMANFTGDVGINVESGCPASDPTNACGFKTGSNVLIFDDSGAFDIFRVTGVVASPLALQHAGQTFTKQYAVGAYVTEVVAMTYWWKNDATNEVYQLMKYDGYQTDLPVVDNVVKLSFEYFGEPGPPVLRKALTDPKGPWTNYGPKPPVVGVANAPWPNGENCMFQVTGGKTVTRTEMSAALGAGAPLVGLTKAQLEDGPWCPSATAANRFDADLMRIRKVRVNMRVQVANKSMRGAAGALFTKAGRSSGGDRFVPDHEISFDVAPRNMNLTR